MSEKSIKKVFTYIIFYLMLWMRPIIIRIGKLIAGFLMIVFIVGVIQLFVLPNNIGWSRILGFGLTSFIIFMLTEYYDNILLKINPTGNRLFLGK
ncbi:hypothetical protein [Anabaena azotica]|uniref:SxtJ n=1 Tax=Anabaena azotica FACHB-119 TaxID=947527 RepID=A0ABR8DAC7_9NOST|nr:hypothetical protein [Anabaena azotica]MBD2503896.1 hypothetical protein [Anabaena azotica FACHB-119]